MMVMSSTFLTSPADGNSESFLVGERLSAPSCLLFMSHLPPGTSSWFFLVCVRRMCRKRLPDTVKHLPQCSQLYGFSPLCVRLCCKSLQDLVKHLPQSSQ